MRAWSPGCKGDSGGHRLRSLGRGLRKTHFFHSPAVCGVPAEWIKWIFPGAGGAGAQRELRIKRRFLGAAQRGELDFTQAALRSRFKTGITLTLHGFCRPRVHRVTAGFLPVLLCRWHAQILFCELCLHRTVPCIKVLGLQETWVRTPDIDVGNATLMAASREPRHLGLPTESL